MSVQDSPRLTDPNARTETSAEAADFPASAVSASAQSTLLSPPYVNLGGFAWQASLPMDIEHAGDSMERPRASRLRLFEDGVPLRRPHALHATIEQEGGGAYSHWRDQLQFSTTDNTDPNTNGRAYSVSLAPRRPVMLCIGQCRAHFALQDLAARGLADVIGDDIGLSYSAAESLQLVEAGLGLLDIAGPKRSYCSAPSANAADLFERADVVVLGLGWMIHFEYDGVILNSSQLHNSIIHPISAQDRAARRLARIWFARGLVWQDEAAREQTSKALLELMSDGSGFSDLDRDIVVRVRGRKESKDDIARDIRKIRDLLARPVCAVSGPRIYTPDGRPMTWPGNFLRDIEEVCQSIGVPYINESDLVARYGPKFSLMPDLRYYTPQFNERLGDEILNVAMNLLMREGRVADQETQRGHPAA